MTGPILAWFNTVKYRGSWCKYSAKKRSHVFRTTWKLPLGFLATCWQKFLIGWVINGLTESSVAGRIKSSELKDRFPFRLSTLSSLFYSCNNTWSEVDH